MPLMEWKEEHSVGIETADKHHQKLISMINSLYDAMQEGSSREIVSKILSALIVYTDKHFKYEEELFKTYNYPGFISHKKQHDELIKQVQELSEKFNTGTTTISIELMRFLKHWLTEHIMVADKKYTEFLNSKGVK